MRAKSQHLGHIKLLRSKFVSRNTKLKLYKTVICPILSYGLETWTATTVEMRAIRIVERKAVRKKCGPVKGGLWGIRTK
jgi:hypothetical protein